MIALLSGIALTCLALLLQPRIADWSVRLMVGGGALAFGTAAVSKVIIQLVLVVPGLLVGWVARTRGIPLAAIAGLVGALIYSMTLGTVLQIPSHPYLPNPWAWVIGDVLAQGAIAGVAGGAGQLLRTGRSPQRTGVQIPEGARAVEESQH